MSDASTPESRVESESGVAATTQRARSLRTLYFVRAAFSIVWVALVFGLASSATVAAGPTAVASVLLVIYPIWDVVATVFDLRANRSAQASALPQLLNMAFGVAAAIAIGIAITVGLTPAIVAFGVWAFISGAVQFTLALIRRRTLGAQWPMIISGGLSVVAGIAFAIMAGSPTSGLTSIASYSAFGAFWYLVGALLLIRSVRIAARTPVGDRA
jgi:uncharacterized membrane protein HdeD (DUF308 family)